ncbi:MAG: hypothetical protein Wins2KO_24280 [Winogradskyella sp.]
MRKLETRKEEIVRVAAQLFKEKGYSAVTMRDLAAEMGIKAASLYNHITSKQDILQTIIISLAEEFTEGMNEVIRSEKSSIEKLKKIVQLHVTIASANTNGMASLNTDWMHLEDQLEYYLKLRNDYEQNFLVIIKEGVKNLEIKSKNPEVIMFSMLSTLRSLYLWLPNKEDVSSSDLALHLSEILIEGINK